MNRNNFERLSVFILEGDTDTNPWRYCGEYFDRETGTVYLRARYYEPVVGRLTYEDSVRSSTMELPGEQKVIDPLSLNLYIYCHNNPILFLDPSGHSVSVDAYGNLAEAGASPSPYIMKTSWQKMLSRYYEGQEKKAAEIKFRSYLALAKASSIMKGVSHFDPEYDQLLGETAFAMMEAAERIQREEMMWDYATGSAMAGSLKVLGSSVSKIGGSPLLSRIAGKLGKNSVAQKEADRLVQKLIAGNGNPGIGSKNLFKGVSYLRGDSGIRVFYRIRNGTLEILAKTLKGGETKVIAELTRLYK